MDFVPRAAALDSISDSSVSKAGLSVRSMLLTGALSGVLLGLSTAFAYRSFDGLSGGVAYLLSGIVFPVGFAMIALLGLELVTGNFATLTVGVLRQRLRVHQLLRNWLWVYVGNLLGSLFIAYLLMFALTGGFVHDAGPLGEHIIEVAESKTLAYQAEGMTGWTTALVKGSLCNWLVALGSVLAYVSTSAFGKVASVWLPIAVFFALALEHSVVNMFVIPSGMLLDADVSLVQWLWWNQLPVTLGNIVGGAVFTACLLHFATVQQVTPSLQET